MFPATSAYLNESESAQDTVFVFENETSSDLPFLTPKVKVVANTKEKSTHSILQMID